MISAAYVMEGDYLSVLDFDHQIAGAETQELAARSPVWVHVLGNEEIEAVVGFGKLRETSAKLCFRQTNDLAGRWRFSSRTGGSGSHREVCRTCREKHSRQ